MRGLTIAIVAGAIVLIVAIALFVRQDPGPGDQAPRQAPIAAGPKPQADKAGSRSARVADRLSQLRDDYEHRQAGELGQPQAKPREVPTAAKRAAQMPAVADDEGDDEDDEDPVELEQLKTTLFKNPDPDERIGAVLMLTGDEGPESLRVLLQAMDDPNPEVRLAVVEAIGDRAEDIAPSTLAPAMKDPDAEVRFEAVSILGDMEDQPDALVMVREALEDPDEDVRALADGIMDFAEDDNEQPTPQQQQPQRKM